MEPLKLERSLEDACNRLLRERNADGHWEGRLSSSALSTAVAAFALAKANQAQHGPVIRKALNWLTVTQSADGGWGDTPESPSNFSTSLLCRCAFCLDIEAYESAIKRADAYIRDKAGGTDSDSIVRKALDIYGEDRTFSAPILAMCAMAGLLGDPSEAWRRVPALPFELAILPHRLFRFLRLQVVSYALPALVAVGLVRHRCRPSSNPLVRLAQNWAARRALRIAGRCQPQSGGFLEAAPLTAFVVMCLCHIGLQTHPIVRKGVGFLLDSIREDGSLPIDTNLATWVTTLSINALPDEKIDLSEPRYLVKYLLDQQHRVEHPFTRARPGGWAWTDLSGGVPDGDDTSGALLALARLRPFASEDSRLPAAANRAMEWLLEIQNRDGGVPTFCRGWGKLPFDQSCPDLTAHALQAWRAWRTEAPEGLRRRVDIGRARAVRYLRASQREDGAWLPRWFGNQGVPDHSNPIYGTAQALRALWKELPETDPATQKAVHFLLSAQNADGSWSAHPGIAPTIEESALALAALASSRDPALASAIERGACWLMDRLGKIEELPSAPIGLYFASLWYDEKLYPLVWMVLALRKAREYFAQVGR